MKNRNRTVFSTLITKLLFWAAERIFGTIPVIGPIFRVAAFVLA